MGRELEFKARARKGGEGEGEIEAARRKPAQDW